MHKLRAEPALDRAEGIGGYKGYVGKVIMVESKRREGENMCW